MALYDELVNSGINTSSAFTIASAVAGGVDAPTEAQTKDALVRCGLDVNAAGILANRLLAAAAGGGGGGDAGATDGDKGDIVVSGTGATWSIDPTVATAAGRAIMAAADAGAQKTALAITAADVAPVAPVSVSAATTLTRATHGNRQIIFSGSSATLTVGTDVDGGWVADDTVEVHTATGSPGIPTLLTPDGKSISGASSKIIGASRKGADSWTVGTTDAAVSSVVMPNLFDGVSSIVSPQRGGTAQSFFGVQGPTSSGTLSVPASTSVNGIAYPARTKNTSTTTTANSACNNGHTTTAEPMVSPGTNTAEPAARARGAYVVADALTACRVAFGITAAPPTSGEPSAALNCAFFGADSTDTQISFYHNDGAGACTKDVLNAGTGFPANTNLQDLYEWYVEILPGTTRTINYYIKNINSGVVATGSTTTDIPTAGTALRVQHLRNTGANTGTAVSYEFGPYATGGWALMGATS